MSAISVSKREKVYLKYTGRCAYCGDTILRNELHVDHLIPASKGGTNDMENLMPCCLICNGFKANLSIEGFRSKIYNILSSGKIQVAIKFGLLSKQKILSIKFYFETKK